MWRCDSQAPRCRYCQGSYAACMEWYSVTHFNRSSARLSEGFCPLCGCPLGTPSREEPLETTCTFCDVSWLLHFLERRPLISASRRLKPIEIKQLYAANEYWPASKAGDPGRRSHHS